MFCHCVCVCVNARGLIYRISYIIHSYAFVIIRYRHWYNISHRYHFCVSANLLKSLILGKCFFFFFEFCWIFSDKGQVTRPIRDSSNVKNHFPMDDSGVFRFLKKNSKWTSDWQNENWTENVPCYWFSLKLMQYFVLEIIIGFSDWGGSFKN